MTDAAKTELEVSQEAAQEKANATNETRTGKGTRVKVGLTRGRNPQVISFEAFDEKKEDSLPTSLSEFMETSKINDEKVIVGLLIDGFNASAYTTASDPIAEFIDASWDDKFATAFRSIVRQYASQNSITVEAAAELLKPMLSAKK